MRSFKMASIDSPGRTINMKSAQWQEGVQDARDEYLSDWITTLDVAVTNEWRVLIFVRGAK